MAIKGVCSNCWQEIGEADVCPYCGTRNQTGASTDSGKAPSGLPLAIPSRHSEGGYPQAPATPGRKIRRPDISFRFGLLLVLLILVVFGIWANFYLLPVYYTAEATGLNAAGDYEGALAMANRGLDRDAGSYSLWTAKAMILGNLKRYEESLQTSDKALSIYPDGGEAWAVKGYALSQLYRPEEALAACNKAVAISPDSAFVWSERGWVLFKLGHYPESLEAAEKAIKLDPDYSTAYIVKHNACMCLKRYDEADAARKKAESLGYKSGK